MQKITYLEGLRGLCCFIVVFDHCVNSFFPALRFTGVSQLRDFIAWSPINLVYSGIPSVYIFFILSGFVLSNKYNQYKDNSILISATIKRYPRLIIPIFFSMVVMFILFKLSNTLFDTSHNLTIYEVFKQSFIYAPFGGGKLTNGVLWTIVYEIYGSFLVFSVLAIFGRYKYKYIIYIILFVFTFNSYYCLFVFGMIINSIYNDGIKFEIKNNYISYFILAISLIFMAFPYIRNGVEIGGIYSKMMIFDINSPPINRVIFSKIGAMLLFWSMFNLKSAVTLFNKPPLQFMGKISFSVYILHMPFLIFVSVFASKFNDGIERLFFMTSLVYILTIIASILFEKLIDQGSVKYMNKLAAKVV